MESQLVYFLGRNREGFIARLKEDNRRYQLGYQFVEDGANNIFIEDERYNRFGAVGSAPHSLSVNRNIKGKSDSLDNQVENLITIADAYPQEVTWEQLRGVSNPTIRDRHMDP